MCRDINRLLSVNDLAEVRRQLLVGRVSACPESVAADGRRRVDVKVCIASRLKLMNQVCVPPGCTSWVSEVGRSFCGHEIWPNDGYTG